MLRTPIKTKHTVQSNAVSIPVTWSWFSKTRHRFGGGREGKKKIFPKLALPSTVCTILALTGGALADPQPNKILAGHLLMYCETAEISQVPFSLLMELTAFCNWYLHFCKLVSFTQFLNQQNLAIFYISQR